MAKIEEGQIGDFRGKIGRVVITDFRGMTVGRSAPKQTTKPPTEAQMDQRLRFALATGFVSGMGDIVQLGYQNVKFATSPANMAVKEILASGITGSYPNYEINFPKVMISKAKGNTAIDNIVPINKTAVVNNRTTLSWEALETGRTVSLPTDNLYVLFYNATEEYFINYPAAAKRSQLTATLRTPHEEETDIVHAWALYVSADGTRVSKSKYLGLIQ
jgi:hypothetical protein